MVKHLLLVSLLAIPFVPSMGQTIKKADNVAMLNISSMVNMPAHQSKVLS